MKTIRIHTLLISIVMFVVGLESNAQTLPSSGTWEATTVTQDQTVNLTGKISLIGCITVDNGAKLVIRNTGSSKNIFNEIDMSTELDHMFVIKGGATLEIDGGSNGITLGGGASFNVDNVQYDDFGCIKDTTSFGTPVRTMSNSAIFNQDGSLSLNKVTIQNVCINSSDYNSNDTKTGASGTIRHNQGTTIIKNCTIKLCKGWTGAGIFAPSNSKGEITIENTTFQHCINTITYLSTHGGTIRAWGTSSVHLNLTNVKVHHCFSQVDAAALYWPANGKNSDGRFATLTFDGCEFYNNKAQTQNGGALDLCGTVQFVNNVTKVHDNYAATYGGGISIRPYNSGSPATEALNVVYDVTDKLDVYDNTAQRGGGIAFYSEYAGSTLPTGTSFEINLNGASVHENHAVAPESGNGGGILLRNDYTGPDFSFTFNLNKGSVYNNTASQDGGGVYLYGWKLVSSDKQGDILKIYDNNATSYGGGLFINVGSDYTMNNGQIYGNTANFDGGGVYMRSGNFTMNQGELNTNTSGRNGGGLLIQNGEIKLNNGTISGNSASNSGGGICNTGGGSITMNGGTLSNNTAIKNGGGITNTGNGTITIEGGTISYNRAGSRGGGLYNSGSGNLTVNGGSISDNNAGYDGGAFYSSDGEVVVDGGEFNKNEAAHHGGGVFVLGGKILFKNGKLTNNTAVNGGGIFLAAGTSMTFTDGLIAGNKAVENGNVFHTAYNAKAASININGCGGGVYLRSGNADKETSLEINVENGFGLYGNTADRAGDDIVAEGVYTSVTVPNVTSMDLKDFEGKDAQPNWYEDYVYIESGDTHDTGYPEHGILRSQNTDSGKRFQQMLGSTDLDKHLITFTEAERQYSDYVCLSLGYIVLTANIKVTGLNEKENMYFIIEQNEKDFDGNYVLKKSYPVLVKGTGTFVDQRIVRNLMPGYYTVKQMQTGATPWAWAYKVTDPSSGKYEYRELFEDGVNNVFEFTVKHVEDETNVMHDEELKVNKMVEKK